ncbi:hypothetical protein OGAPHI_004582 [Ogataea philodendri]|uniref:Cytochrome c oxidase assembly factor 3 n=1 Tax=Ogataea philodendri TaxID=1378263 RepID=A0A9P8T316_9ASCO|nr:uncharacterized protein OGAPHI_004582 [Ogataea philodendri]KAH3664231.1 hypothetical protein OGAPHI_004582 [Ogataea philodendri]
MVTAGLWDCLSRSYTLTIPTLFPMASHLVLWPPNRTLVIPKPDSSVHLSSDAPDSTSNSQTSPALLTATNTVGVVGSADCEKSKSTKVPSILKPLSQIPVFGEITLIQPELPASPIPAGHVPFVHEPSSSSGENGVLVEHGGLDRRVPQVQRRHQVVGLAVNVKYSQRAVVASSHQQRLCLVETQRLNSNSGFDEPRTSVVPLASSSASDSCSDPLSTESAHAGLGWIRSNCSRSRCKYCFPLILESCGVWRSFLRLSLSNSETVTFSSSLSCQTASSSLYSLAESDSWLSEPVSILSSSDSSTKYRSASATASILLSSDCSSSSPESWLDSWSSSKPRSSSSLVSLTISRASSYYNKYTYQMSPAMLRARQPYFWKNLALFGVLGGISLGIYAYTYSFLMKDDFEDIPIPPISDEQLAELKKEYEASKK